MAAYGCFRLRAFAFVCLCVLGGGGGLDGSTSGREGRGKLLTTYLTLILCHLVL